VLVDTPSAAAISGTVASAYSRIVATSAATSLTEASSVSAASMDSIDSASRGCDEMPVSVVRCWTGPPRFSRCLSRRLSDMICRIARAATARKCGLSLISEDDFETFIHASWTSAVGRIVALAPPR
jgi:hypothetical protein